MCMSCVREDVDLRRLLYCTVSMRVTDDVIWEGAAKKIINSTIIIVLTIFVLTCIVLARFIITIGSLTVLMSRDVLVPLNI